MKKMNLQNLAVAVLTATTSCNRMGHRTTVIATDDNGDVKRIEYSGKVVFNEQQTGVDYISEGGFLKFEHNGQKIAASGNNKGKVAYEYNGEKVAALDKAAKALLADAVKAASAQQARVKAEQGR